MTWFFAILLVALMGAVAVVAAGYGTAMAEVYDDRPDSRVPVDGPLTEADIRHVRFSTAFRGYRMSEVDALLDRVAAEMRQRHAEPSVDLPQPWPADLASREGQPGRADRPSGEEAQP